MISINDLTVSFGGFDLFKDVNFHINDADRIGLVGKNGAGKSTMLKIIMGINHPTSGIVTIPSGCKLGYLPQIMEHAKDKSVYEETLTAFSELKEAHRQIDEIGEQLATRTDYQSAEYNKLIVRLNELNELVALEESEPVESQLERILLGLGFKKDEFSRPTREFSQGWNMRIELAKILLRKPSVLLLDEPTNHLDIESIEWFESYLKDFKGSILLISHDRKFLDNVTNRTVEIMCGKIYDYKVPYSRYKILRAERMSQQKAAFENQQRMIDKTEEFIERFRYKPTKSNQVQSRIKQLEKIERIEIDQEDLSKLAIKFPPAPRSGQVVFKVTDAVIGYPNKVILRDSNMIIERGEKVAFVGRNGEGKTTMMCVLCKELFPFDGEATVGFNVDLGYYAQNQDDILDKNITVYDTLDQIAVGDIRTKLRDILAAFLFKGEDIDKKVAVLSGGEKARLAMAKLMLRPHNLLALDEPTNHMDLLSKDIIKQALMAYDGTLVIVSHDRDFLDGLVNKIYEFKDGRVKEHLGGVNDFLARKRLDNMHELERAEVKVSVSEASVKSTAKSTESQQNTQQSTPKAPKLSYAEQKELARIENRKKQKIAKLEEEIASMEEQLAAIEKELEGDAKPDNLMKLSVQYEEIKNRLDRKMDEWSSLA